MDRNPFDEAFDAAGLTAGRPGDIYGEFDREKREAKAEPKPSPRVAHKGTGRPVFHPNVVQGSEEWLEMRRGLLTASEMKLIITPTLKMAANDKERAHVNELAAQRINKFVEPHFVSDDMIRGHDDEIDATIAYGEKYGAVEPIGFVTNDRWGFTLGYSPDAKVVGKNAGIENKSRRQKFQIETICNLEMPVDYVIQVQGGLVVSEWEWIDFNSYCGGMPMVTLRVHPDDAVQDAIIEAAGACEYRIAQRIARYEEVLASDARLIPTERKIIQEIF